MRVLVVGAYGLVGSVIAETLLLANYKVLGIGRRVDSARVRYPEITWIKRDLRHLTSSEEWLPLLEGVDAVVNAAGTLQDGPDDDTRAVQYTAMCALFAACESRRVKKFVQVSAVGASADNATLFMRSKAEADAVLAASDLDWLILRPGLVLSSTAYGATALLRALAAFPIIIPVASGGAQIQTVYVGDVADAVRAALEGAVASRCSYDLVETQAHSLQVLVNMLRAWLGFAPAPQVKIPRPIARFVFRVGDVLGQLGWRTPLRTTALKQIEASIIGDSTAWRAASEGPDLLSLHQTLRRMRSSVQERWFARMWLMKPIMIATLAFFWIVSGFVGLVRFEAATTVLTQIGFAASAAAAAVLGGSLADLAIGLALIVRKTMTGAAISAIALSIAYLAAATIWLPSLWLDPLGPLLKTIPQIALALAVLSIASDR